MMKMRGKWTLVSRLVVLLLTRANLSQCSSQKLFRRISTLNPNSALTESFYSENQLQIFLKDADNRSEEPKKSPQALKAFADKIGRSRDIEKKASVDVGSKKIFETKQEEEKLAKKDEMISMLDNQDLWAAKLFLLPHRKEEESKERGEVRSSNKKTFLNNKNNFLGQDNSSSYSSFPYTAPPMANTTSTTTSSLLNREGGGGEGGDEERFIIQGPSFTINLYPVVISLGALLIIGLILKAVIDFEAESNGHGNSISVQEYSGGDRQQQSYYQQSNTGYGSSPTSGYGAPVSSGYGSTNTGYTAPAPSTVYGSSNSYETGNDNYFANPSQGFKADYTDAYTTDFTSSGYAITGNRIKRKNRADGEGETSSISPFPFFPFEVSSRTTGILDRVLQAAGSVGGAGLDIAYQVVTGLSDLGGQVAQDLSQELQSEEKVESTSDGLRITDLNGNDITDQGDQICTNSARK